MALSDVHARASILSAIAEFDEVSCPGKEALDWHRSESGI